LTEQVAENPTRPVVDFVRRARQLQQQNAINRTDSEAIASCFQPHGRTISVSDAQLMLSGFDQQVQDHFKDLVQLTA
jgi:hypothetical protein